MADYNTPELILRIEDLGGVAFAVTVILGLIMIIARVAVRLDRRKDDLFIKKAREAVRPDLDDIKAMIEQRTIPIQPNENGGKSLADVNKKVDDYMSDWDTRFSAVEAKLGIKDRRELPPSVDELADLS